MTHRRPHKLKKGIKREDIHVTMPSGRGKQQPVTKQAHAKGKHSTSSSIVNIHFHPKPTVARAPRAKQAVVQSPAPVTAQHLAQSLGGYVKTSQPLSIETLDSIKTRMNKMESEIDKLARYGGQAQYSRTLGQAMDVIQQQHRDPPPEYPANNIIEDFKNARAEIIKETPAQIIGGSEDNTSHKFESQKLHEAILKRPIFDTPDPLYSEEDSESDEKYPTTPSSSLSTPSSTESSISVMPPPGALVQSMIDKLRMASSVEEMKAILRPQPVRPRNNTAGKVTLAAIMARINKKPKRENGTWKDYGEMEQEIIGHIKNLQ